MLTTILICFNVYICRVFCYYAIYRQVMHLYTELVNLLIMPLNFYSWGSSLVNFVFGCLKQLHKLEQYFIGVIHFVTQLFS